MRRRESSTDPATKREVFRLEEQARRGEIDGAAAYRARRDAFRARLEEPIGAQDYNDLFGHLVIEYDDDPEVLELARRRHDEVMRNRARLMEAAR